MNEALGRQATEAARPAAPEPHVIPGWIEELQFGLSVWPHFVMSGNVRDLYAAPSPHGPRFIGFAETVWQTVRRKGIVALLIHDPIKGLRLHPSCNADVLKILKSHDIVPGDTADTVPALRDLQARIARLDVLPTALIIDHVGHVRTDPHDAAKLFVSADQSARAAALKRPKVFAHAPRHNPTIWITDRVGDLPDWFTVRNDTLREIVVGPPNLEDRFAFARALAGAFSGDGPDDTGARDRALQHFALQCDGETLIAMRTIAGLARKEDLALGQAADAIRIYRTGSRRNPWRSPLLKARIRYARDFLLERIKGQNAAVEKTLDIVARSVTGLSGAQTGSRHTRPRGVLFFAGPTGVGKTELAKAVTELLFGDQMACNRFDMSEFMEEASITRLIGAPPGHPGHNRGGELTNALNRRPFSVFLFDEVEKAHPRVLDMFLQVLDEGRLTDARGSTAYFSEALIIFTSNIGMIGDNKAMNMGMNVLPSESYAGIERKIIRAVQDHFRFDLRRPELVNRIGQNIVVFDFIRPAGERAIFDLITERVVDTVKAEHGIALDFAPEAYMTLRQICTRDVFDGGRGIGNRVETHLINPLARKLLTLEDRDRIRIERVDDDGETAVITFG